MISRNNGRWGVASHSQWWRTKHIQQLFWRVVHRKLIYYMQNYASNMNSWKLQNFIIGIFFERYQNIHEDHRTNPCFQSAQRILYHFPLLFGEGELPTSFWCSCDGQSSHWCGACYFSGAWGAVFAGRHDLQQCLCQLGALVVHPTVQHTPQQFNINMNLHTLCIHLYAHVCVMFTFLYCKLFSCFGS